MVASFKLGKILGIPIGVHSSWFILFALLTFSLSTGYFPSEYPDLSLTMNIILGLVTSLLFFGSVLAHELGHSIFALRNNIPVKSITLFIFGGVAQIEREPKSPGAEFRIAIAGPITSLTLAAIFGGLWMLDQNLNLLAAPSRYLMRINFLLAVFNMIPGFPLDGGRVLRAFVWQVTGNLRRANRVAVLSGQIVAYGFIAYGVYWIFTGRVFDGLWLIFIGWFLQNAATSTRSQTQIQDSLQGVKVSQVMTCDCDQVTNLQPINQLVEESVLTRGKRCFFVTSEGQLQGMLTLRDIAKIPEQKWRFTTTEQAMVPLSRLEWVEPDDELLKALRIMDSKNVAQLPVLSKGELVGMLSREQIVSYIRARAELGV
ncbi:MAG: site-2 protease family protein [Anaerolineales bacterium]|nr:site-2 protease family protein [Anaerolineales bacterium]